MIWYNDNPIYKRKRQFNFLAILKKTWVISTIFLMAETIGLLLAYKPELNNLSGSDINIFCLIRAASKFKSTACYNPRFQPYSVGPLWK